MKKLLFLILLVSLWGCDLFKTEITGLVTYNQSEFFDQAPDAGAEIYFINRDNLTEEDTKILDSLCYKWSPRLLSLGYEQKELELKLLKVTDKISTEKYLDSLLSNQFFLRNSAVKDLYKINSLQYKSKCQDLKFMASSGGDFKALLSNGDYAVFAYHKRAMVLSSDYHLYVPTTKTIHIESNIAL